ncbi:protease pro-enzyme activation domain-containing protein [Pullulanibacillus sp. KACC 23026]|uniref:S53 family peptidase n=1 Tax=Pullulanibacillus sp. KACC 23026 TaxID=3028315 RepID=UPI0023B00F59|nr:protease pro-enzyme activation domain-containing protein [Pullulanibacillus sp. KACC 23026]WEG13131.1 protease pro-enzyme activation domain-containing protein [Pullulanibacillus sp. KACC 23026]
MSFSRKWKRKVLTIVAASALAVGIVPGVTHAAAGSDASSTTKVTVPQGIGANVLSNADYFGGEDPSDVVTIDVVLKVQNKDQLADYINETVTPGNNKYHKFLNVSQFKAKYAPSPNQVNAVTKYFKSYGIQTTAYPDNLIVSATGTVAQLNKALNVDIQKASYKGKFFHASKKDPKVPSTLADAILCILGLSDYSGFSTNTVKPVVKNSTNTANDLHGNLSPQDFANQYDLKGLYDQGATGKGQTIGIVTLADFDTNWAYTFWKEAGLSVDQNRINEINVDGGSGTDGAEETALDVEQSGSVAPDAKINVYVAPNNDSGFVDGFAKAINDNQASSLSVSWGQSESSIDYFVDQDWETPAYAEVFNQLFMQAAAQGISTFASAGDSGAYDNARLAGYKPILPGFTAYDLTVDDPADSPYITAAGGTTLPVGTPAALGVKKERAWGWDYLQPLLQQLGYGIDSGLYFVGGGGGFSNIFATPDYQKDVSGVNTYTGITDFNVTDDSPTVNQDPKLVTGTGTGRNMPDLALNADPESGYAIYGYDADTDAVDWYGIGGTSAVAPQLNGITALINSAGGGRVGFWNPQIYRFAQQANSPFTPLNDQGTSNDNLYYTGTPGTLYNQATGLGTPDVTKLAKDFLGD